ncbi:MAG: ABC transporter ATP-binding protein [Patescibacteria group bacterium]|nr:ABC transporter ATP-binding protein [Patescibacteria group bacterium]MDD5715180.1 ABC transporter ATP-binding protein [Patescibacteria group bacterium]
MQQQETIIQVNKIFKTYRLGEVHVPALKNVSLTIHKGDFLIITGRNGSGKSTLLRQLGLLDKPDSGEILLKNKDVTKMPERERASIRLKRLGYIFQEYALIAELSAVENVMLPAMMLESSASCRKRAIEVLKKVGLEYKIKNLPRQLSGGEQQKVAIARALINHPEVIFADEPTANLDSIAAKDVLKVFKRLNEHDQSTIVMITHEEEETAYGHRIIKLADGSLV